MTNSVSPIILFSLLFLTDSLNATTHLSTGSSPQGEIQDITVPSTTVVDGLDSSIGTKDQTLNSTNDQTLNSSNDQTLNSNNNSLAEVANNVSASSQNVSTEKESNGDLGGSLKWNKVDALLKSQMRGILDNLNFENAIRQANARDACKTDLERYLNSLSNLEPWSVRSKFVYFLKVSYYISIKNML